jgi:hypothetical protein
MKRWLRLAVACAALILTVAASAAPTKRTDDCTWGASSVVVESVNGELVQSEPSTSGCMP